MKRAVAVDGVDGNRFRLISYWHAACGICEKLATSTRNWMFPDSNVDYEKYIRQENNRKKMKKTENDKTSPHKSQCDSSTITQVRSLITFTKAW